jgi:hypothetical protein
MSDETWVRIRPLSGTEFREGFETGWQGKIVDIQFATNAAAPELPPGTLVEMESGSRFYLGILQESHASGVSILVEHKLERSEIDWIQDVWG